MRGRRGPYNSSSGKVVWPSKYETGGFGRMIGSPSIQHKPPEPGYIDVIQSITKWNPYITRCGRVGKT